MNNYYNRLKDKLKHKYDLDIVRDVIFSQDNVIITFLDANDSSSLNLEIVKGSLQMIGLAENASISLKALLAMIDYDNAYAKVSGTDEYDKHITDSLLTFSNNPDVTLPIKTSKGRVWLRISVYTVSQQKRLYSVFIMDVTQTMIDEEAVFEKTHTDALTGLFNKYTLDYHYGLRYQDKDFHVLFLDIDNFKQLNDTLGHKTGNYFLEQFGKILSSHHREHNYFYRIGGDEFVGLFFTSPSAIKRIAKNIVNKTQFLAQSLDFPFVTVSIAVIKAEQRDDVIRKADNVMYDVKSNGKNHFIYRLESEIKN